MAIIDYSDVTSGRYAQLSLPAKALIPVLATLADKKTGLVPAHDSKVSTLADFAGISYHATRVALQLLHDTNRVSLSNVPGHQARIIYLPTAQFSSKAGSRPRRELARDEVASQDQLNFAPEPPTDSKNQERHDSCSNSFFKQFKELSLSIVTGFYTGIGQKKISKAKRERAFNIEKKLRADGFSLEDIAFAVEWTLENAEKELYDFAIIEHTISQALAARDKIESERRAIEERDKAVQDERSREEAKQLKRQEIETHKADLSPEEREELREEAHAELIKSEVPAGMINDFLLKIKENEILRTSGHARAASSL